MKKLKDLIKFLKKANPEGVIVISDGSGDYHLVTNLAFLNIETYGKKNSSGVDITKNKTEKDFVGLPFYKKCDLVEKKKQSKKMSSSDFKLFKKFNHLMSIEQMLDQINKFDDDALLVSFDSYLIKDIKFAGNNSIKCGNPFDPDYYGVDKNDFIILIKGEKLKNTLKGKDDIEEAQEEVIKKKTYDLKNPADRALFDKDKLSVPSKNIESSKDNTGKVQITMEEKDDELNEKYSSKAQQRYFYYKASGKGKEAKKWKKMASEFSKDMTKKDWKNLPEKAEDDVNEEEVFEIMKENENPRMSKKSLIEYVNKLKDNNKNVFKKSEIITKFKEN